MQGKAGQREAEAGQGGAGQRRAAQGLGTAGPGTRQSRAAQRAGPWGEARQVLDRAWARQSKQRLGMAGQG